VVWMRRVGEWLNRLYSRTHLTTFVLNLSEVATESSWNEFQQSGLLKFDFSKERMPSDCSFLIQRLGISVTGDDASGFWNVGVDFASTAELSARFLVASCPD